MIIEIEINKRKILASMKETPHCFGECLTVGDVYEVLEIKEKEMLDDEIKFLEELDKFYGYDPKMNEMIKERLQKLEGASNETRQ